MAVKAIQVRPFKPTTFLVVKSDGDGPFTVRDEFERAVVIVIDSVVGERFTFAPNDDGVAFAGPADIDLVTRHAIEVCEGALDSLAVDVSRAHFQLESKNRLTTFAPCGASRANRKRAPSKPEATTTMATRNRVTSMFGNAPAA